jgi:hypothetical protein
LRTRSGKAIDCGIAKNLNADESIHCDLIQLTTAVSVRTTFIAIRSARESTLAFGGPFIASVRLWVELAAAAIAISGRDENFRRRIDGRLRQLTYLKDLQNRNNQLVQGCRIQGRTSKDICFGCTAAIDLRTVGAISEWTAAEAVA